MVTAVVHGGRARQGPFHLECLTLGSLPARAGEWAFGFSEASPHATRDFPLPQGEKPRSMAFLPLLQLLGVYIFESRPEFQTARGETATAVKLSALRSRHIHFVDVAAVETLSTVADSCLLVIASLLASLQNVVL